MNSQTHKNFIAVVLALTLPISAAGCAKNVANDNNAATTPSAAVTEKQSTVYDPAPAPDRTRPGNEEHTVHVHLHPDRSEHPDSGTHHQTEDSIDQSQSLPVQETKPIENPAPVSSGSEASAVTEAAAINEAVAAINTELERPLYTVSYTQSGDKVHLFVLDNMAHYSESNMIALKNSTDETRIAQGEAARDFLTGLLKKCPEISSLASEVEQFRKEQQAKEDPALVNDVEENIYSAAKEKFAARLSTFPSAAPLSIEDITLNKTTTEELKKDPYFKMMLYYSPDGITAYTSPELSALVRNYPADEDFSSEVIRAPANKLLKAMVDKQLALESNKTSVVDKAVTQNDEYRKFIAMKSGISRRDLRFC